MAGNTLGMCASTPIHLGWRDTDGDGALDPVDPVGNPNPLIDLGKFCSFVPFLCQLIGLGATRAGGPVASRASAGRRPVPAGTATRGRAGRAPAPGADRRRDGPRRAAVRAEELQYLEALERKLRTAADAIARDRARDR